MMAEHQEDEERVLVQVCIECGKEYTFTDAPPQDLVCEKCGNGVFRAFYDGGSDEASDDFRETTDRDVGTDASASEVLPGDLEDLREL
jgi:transcription initiation factor TFIIIB Brf1 subunit/transcription initiation factor TFIIB